MQRQWGYILRCFVAVVVLVFSANATMAQSFTLNLKDADIPEPSNLYDQPGPKFGSVATRGENDSLVPIIWAASCHNELKKAGVKSVMHKVDGAGHIQAAADATALTKAYEFLAKELNVATAETR